MDAGPAEAVAADPDAVAKRLAIGENEIEPPLGGVDDNGSGRIIADKAHGLPRNRVRSDYAEIGAAADAEIGAAADQIGPVLGARGAGAGQQRHRRKQQSKNSHHLAPAKNQLRRKTGHNWRDFASNEPVSAASFNHWRYRNNTASAGECSVRSSKSQTQARTAPSPLRGRVGEGGSTRAAARVATPTPLSRSRGRAIAYD